MQAGPGKEWKILQQYCYNDLTMGYFFSELSRDWKVYSLVVLALVAGLNIMDIITFMLMGNGLFNLWVVKITLGVAVAGAIIYGSFLHRREKKSRQLEVLLPALALERRAFFEKMTAADAKFQTFCHECRHYDDQRRRCLLRLHGRQARIKLRPGDVFSYCLYWNLEDHPVLALTEHVKALARDEAEVKKKDERDVRA